MVHLTLYHTHACSCCLGCSPFRTWLQLLLTTNDTYNIGGLPCRYDYQTTFFTGHPPILSQGVGWAIVLGFGMSPSHLLNLL